MKELHLEEEPRLRLSDIDLERKAGLLPEDLREPFLWLGAYTREDCAGDVGVLTERMRELHVATDKTTWMRVLKGQLCHNPNGTPRESPLLNRERLLEEIGVLRSGVKLASGKGRVPFVMTTVATAIFRFVDLKCAPERVNRFGVIIGETGTQKTASLKEYAKRNNHGRCIWMEAPENGSMSEFISHLAESYGGPTREPYDRKRRRIFESFNARKCIIVDNCQRLYRADRMSDQPLFGFLQRLQDECGGSIILSITPAFERTLTQGMLSGFFEQFEGRAGGRRNFLRLPAFAPPEDVVKIAQAFGLELAKRSEKYLCQIAQEPGRIRRLFEDLQDAKLAAEKEKKPLTIAHVLAAREDEKEEA